MSDYSYQVALIVPDAQVEAARGLAEAMGWGPGNYTAELTDGTNTFWGLSTVAAPAFIDMLNDPGAIVLEEGQAEFDAAVAVVMPVLLQSVEAAGTRSQGAQFDALCAANGLQRVTQEGEA